jgi:Smg protein
MKENVLDILIYLFEHYMLENPDKEPDEESIMIELIQAGFNHMTIDSAFDWLENLAIMCDEHDADASTEISENSMRHYHGNEIEKLSLETRSLLLSMEQCGVLSPIAREMVIDRLMALDIDDIELHHVKWVILMVLTNCTGSHPGATDWTEALLLDDFQSPAH